jgi:hypothetical protein
MQFTNEQAGISVFIFAAVVIAFLALIYRSIFVTPRQRAMAQALAGRELANIVEETTPTTWGRFCIGMIVLTAIGAFFAFSAATTTIFQQIEAGVV